METKKAKTTIVAGLVALAGLLWFLTMATAGDLEPSGPPGPTMNTLDQIYDAATSNVSERQGYCTTVIESGGTPTNILTVPGGKRFVVLKLYVKNLTDPAYDNGWELKVDTRLFIDGAIVDITGEKEFEFPDRCVVVNAGESLKFSIKNDTYDVLMTVIGYYYNTQ
jgi:hypothetical protein